MVQSVHINLEILVFWKLFVKLLKICWTFLGNLLENLGDIVAIPIPASSISRLGFCHISDPLLLPSECTSVIEAVLQ